MKAFYVLVLLHFSDRQGVNFLKERAKNYIT